MKYLVDMPADCELDLMKHSVAGTLIYLRYGEAVFKPFNKRKQRKLKKYRTAHGCTEFDENTITIRMRFDRKDEILKSLSNAQNEVDEHGALTYDLLQETMRNTSNSDNNG